MLLSSRIYQNHFSYKQNKKQKKNPNILNNGNISFITWKAERNVLFDDKISSNTNHLSFIQWHGRILATSNILNSAISLANVTLQKKCGYFVCSTIHVLAQRGKCSDQGLVPCVYWTRMRTQKQPPSTRVKQNFHSREAFTVLSLVSG